MASSPLKMLTGRKVLVWFLLFFGLIFAANGIMVFMALSTFSGLETEDAYRKGRTFNSTLEARQAQAALGWQVSVGTQNIGEGRWQLTAHFADSTGADLEGLAVSGAFWNPTGRVGDVSQPMLAEGGGRYSQVFDLPRAGNWQVRLTVNATASALTAAQSERITPDMPLEWRHSVVVQQ